MANRHTEILLWSVNVCDCCIRIVCRILLCLVALCSWLAFFCYPGNCMNGISSCNCSEGFAGDDCLESKHLSTNIAINTTK